MLYAPQPESVCNSQPLCCRDALERSDLDAGGWSAQSRLPELVQPAATARRATGECGLRQLRDRQAARLFLYLPPLLAVGAIGRNISRRDSNAQQGAENEMWEVSRSRERLRNSNVRRRTPKPK